MLNSVSGYVGNTDFEWYQFLSSHPEFQEINFWQPSGGRGFHAISPGQPFFFRLKSPHNAIAGFGYLSRHEILPAWLAWDTFGMANGAATLHEMIGRIAKYRREPLDPHGNNRIGCLMIVDPVFFPRETWVKEPAGWHQNIVQGQTIDLTRDEGLRLWTECSNGARGGASLVQGGAEEPRYGEPLMVRPRLGQGSFRFAVTDAYKSACAVTMEHSLPVLDAAHIRPYADGGAHKISNGLLLRSDIHRLFDKGYVTVAPDMHFQVSRRLRDDYSNGRSYYGLHGQPIHLPARFEDQPDKLMLDWHNRELFRG
ncbi:MAG: HNH endonuclease [Elusimicrobia bacterium]|nr:HNH endonuclease [Elusimicrobiota bacterium]